MSTRNARARKAVNYAKLSVGEDSDDDFQAFSPPNKVKKPKEAKVSKITAIIEAKSNTRSSVSERVFERNLKKTLAKSKELPNIEDSEDETDFQPSLKYKKKASDTSIEEKQSSTTLPSDKSQILTNDLVDTKPIFDKPTMVEHLKENNKNIEEKLPDADKIKKYLRDLENLKENEVKVNPTLSNEKTFSFNNESENLSSEDEEPNSSKAKMAPKEDKPNFTTIKSSRRKADHSKTKQNKPITSKEPPNITPKRKVNVTSNNSPSDLLQLVKPVNLPSVGLRVGLSRKRSAKPLHPNLKPVES